MSTPADSARLPPFVVHELDPHRRAVVEQVTGGRGRFPTPYRVWIASPELARHLHSLGQFFAQSTSLSAAESEIAILCAARRWNADYVLAVHTVEAVAAGVDQAVVDALVRGEPANPIDPRQRAVATLMAALGTDGVPTGAVFDHAVGLLGHDGLAELLALVGYFTAVALAMKAYAVATPGPARRDG